MQCVLSVIQFSEADLLTVYALWSVSHQAIIWIRTPGPRSSRSPSTFFCRYLYEYSMSLEIVQPPNQYRHHFVEENMTDILSTKEIIHLATLGIPKGMKKNVIPASIVSSVQILITNDYLTSEKHNANIVCRYRNCRQSYKH